MEIKKTINGDNLKIALEGRLDTVTAPELEKETTAIAEGTKSVELNMSELEYISSAGLRVILATQKKMNKMGGALVITGVNETIMEVFDMTGFSDILDIQ